MPNRVLFALTVIALLSFGTSPTGSAQDSPTAEVGVERRADMSAAEQFSQAEAIVRRGRNNATTIRNLLDAARRDHDIIRVTCLNDKLTQINSHLTTAEQRMSQLQDAAGSNDTDRANHLYTLLTVVGQKFSTLLQESNQCVGQDLFNTGSTEVTVDIADDVDTDFSTNELPATVTPVTPVIAPPASGDT